MRIDARLSWQSGSALPRSKAKARLARRSRSLENDYERASRVCRAYWEKERQVWNRSDERIQSAAANAARVIVWGAGIHTSQLFARCPSLSRLPIACLADSDPQKHGLTLAGHEVRPLSAIDWSDPRLAVIISTYTGEKEILGTVGGIAGVKAAVVPLYHPSGVSGNGSTSN